MKAAPVLRLRGLEVRFAVRGQSFTVVHGVDLDVHAGETVGVVGESGSGKTVTMMAALGLLPPPPACTVSGEVLLHGRDLLAMTRRELRSVRGREVGMVFQDPMTSLHPSFRVLDQVAEALLVHDRALSRQAAAHRAVELLERVGVPQPGRRAAGPPSTRTSGPEGCGSGR